MMPLLLVVLVPLGVEPVLLSVGRVLWLPDDPLRPPGDSLLPVGPLVPGGGLLTALVVRCVLPCPPGVGLIWLLALVVLPVPSLAVELSAAPFEVASVLRVTTAIAVAREGRVAVVVVLCVLCAAANFGCDVGTGRSGTDPASALAAFCTPGAVARRLGGLRFVWVGISVTSPIAIAMITNPSPSNSLGRRSGLAALRAGPRQR